LRLQTCCVYALWLPAMSLPTCNNNCQFTVRLTLVLQSWITWCKHLPLRAYTFMRSLDVIKSLSFAWHLKRCWCFTECGGCGGIFTSGTSFTGELIHCTFDDDCVSVGVAPSPAQEGCALRVLVLALCLMTDTHLLPTHTGMQSCVCTEILRNLTRLPPTTVIHALVCW